MDGPLVSTIASVSVRDGGYLLLLVVATAVVGLSCVEGERTNYKGWGGEERKERGRVREGARGSESVKGGKRKGRYAGNSVVTKEVWIRRSVWMH